MAAQPGQKPSGKICYELDGEMKLRPRGAEPDPGELKLGTSLHHGNLKVRDSSSIFTDEAGADWHLPLCSAAFDHLTANVPSAPYLFSGYDKKSLSLSNDGTDDVSFKVELDVTGEGDWVGY